MKQTSNAEERQHVFVTLNEESKICDFSTSHNNFNDYIRDKIENTDLSRPIPMNFLVHFDFPKKWYMEMRNLMPFQTLKNNIPFMGAREGYLPKNIISFRKAVFCHLNKLAYNKTLNARENKEYQNFFADQAKGRSTQTEKTQVIAKPQRIVVNATDVPIKKNHIKIR